MIFYGRDNELSKLDDFYRSEKEHLGIICGRRRVGKSELLRKSLASGTIPFVFLQCRRTSEESNVIDFCQQAQSNLKLHQVQAVNFEAALRILYAVPLKQPVVIVLDEYPYLRELIPGLDSLIQYFIDTNPDSQIKWLLCGSYLDVMQGLVEYKSPLYGRASLFIKLEPMNYWDSSRFYSNYSFEDRLRIYSVFGGIPFYNARIDSSLSVKENILRLILNKDAVLINEVSYLLMMEVSKIDRAENVFEIMSNGYTKFTDIFQRSGLASSALLANVLTKLVNIGFLKKVSPINDEHNKKKIRYKFSDPLIDFYFRYVFKNLSKLSVISAERLWDISIRDDFESQYVPKYFEEITKQFLIKENLSNRIEPPFFKIGSYWYDSPNEKKNGEFDVVTEDSEGFVCYECKFKNQPMTAGDIEKEIAQVQASPLPCQRFGFVSRAGFHGKIDNPNVRLFTLADLYESPR